MARRVYTRRMACAQAGCPEVSHFEFTSRREEDEHYKRVREYRCVRHAREDEVLTAEAPVRTAVLVATPAHGRQFWYPLGTSSGSGYAYGPGYKAFAEDFPAGTRLIVTATVEVPALVSPVAALELSSTEFTEEVHDG